MDTLHDETVATDLWATLSGKHSHPALQLRGPEGGWPSVFEVNTLATASVALAVLAVSDFEAQRTGKAPRVAQVDRRHAAVAFRSEAYLKPLGWQLPPVWDPFAGDYPTRDGFIRLHTNYAYHRDAVFTVLGPCTDAAEVKAKVARWEGEALEQAIVERGGCAAAMRSRAEFRAHPQGRALDGEPLFAWQRWEAAAPALPPSGLAPLAGVRVLDLTRVIAGPVCTRFLAAYGADVLRIDPPGFAEHEVLLREVTQGKRRAALDLRTSAGRARFAELLQSAHLLVVGYRSDALERLGFGQAFRTQLNPGLCSVMLDGYGFTGPWATRRGFDSLVQMSGGIAAEGMRAAAADRPTPLPAQALDHATGYLAAAAACRALTDGQARGGGAEVRLSLARTAELLWSFGTPGDPHGPKLTPADAAHYLERCDTPWGPLERVGCPGALEGFTPRWTLPPGPLGVDPPRFADAPLA